MRHDCVALKIVLSILLLNGCALFGDKKPEDMSKAEIEKARAAYIAANPEGPPPPVRITSATVADFAKKNPSFIKQIAKANPKVQDYLDRVAKRNEPEPKADTPRGPQPVVTQPYKGSGAR